MYFEQGKNRSVFALLLLCFSLLECMFFLYASSEMYSPVYPAVLDVLCVSIIACLCYFLDFKRKMNPLFLGIGTLLLSIFFQLCRSYFNSGSEEGFYSLANPVFWRDLLILFAVHLIAVLGTGFWVLKFPEAKAVRFFSAAVLFVYHLFYGRSVITALLLFLFQTGFSFYCDHLKGGTYNSSLILRILLILLFLISSVLLFAYRGGMILTQEACSFPVLFLILVGIVILFLKKVFGLYAIEYLCTHLSLSYVIACLDHAIDSSFLFALVPFGFMLFISSYIHLQSDRTLKEVTK